MKCPACQTEINIGSLIRSVPSKKRSKASAENAKKALAARWKNHAPANKKEGKQP